MNIAILGAPGCVGRHLIKKLLEFPHYEVIASYRKKQDAETLRHDRLEWRQVDLKDLLSTENFLQGADVLIYLIHSLGAKDFEQLDVQLANVAGQAAQKIGVRKIIYLGGIIPVSQQASPHLTSRMKTGEALAKFGGGSSSTVRARLQPCRPERQRRAALAAEVCLCPNVMRECRTHLRG